MLRAAGIEVWFDQSELRGGDAWDAAIRRQIKCGLLCPIISRNTHLREEGYFRLEWKIAVDRSHLMSTHKAFLLPVVIDETRDDDWNVPETLPRVALDTAATAGRLRALLPSGCMRLLTPDTPPAESPPPQSAAATPPSHRGTRAQPTKRRRPASPRSHASLCGGNRTAVWAGMAALAAIVAAAMFLVLGPLRQAPDRLARDPLTDAKFLRLTDFGTEQGAAISRDGRYVAFLADRAGHVDAWVTEIGSNHFLNLTEGQTLQLANSSVRTVGFSPDASLVTLWTRAADGSRPDDVKILAAPIAGGPLKPYLQDAAEYDWTADGKRVVFHTTGPGDPLFVRAAADGAPHQIYIAPAGVHCHFPIWSPDGEFIYFARGVPPANWDIWRIRASGADLERLTTHDTRVSFPVLLDARTLIYLATEADGSGPWPYVMDLTNKLTRRVSAGLERYTSLAASANGARLVATLASSRSDLWHVAINGDGPAQSTASPLEPAIQSAYAPRFGPGYLAYVATAGGRRGIWKLSQGKASELWNDAGTGRVGAPAIAPDGRHIAFTVENQEGKKLYVIDSDGGNARAIGTARSIHGAIAWSPDSQSIVGAIMRDAEPHLATIFLDGRPPQPLVSEYSVDPTWSPDGKYLVYSGADVGTTFPLRASGRDGRPYGMASLILTRGARRVAFAQKTGSLVILRGEIGHKNFWLLDPQTGAEHQLTDLPSKFAIGDFDVAPDGSEIIFDRTQDSSNIALIERAS